MDDMGDMEGGSGDMGSMPPLNHTGVDFSNSSQAADFLGSLLDDTELQVTGNQFAIYFWYGIAVAISVAAFFNLTRLLILKMRMRYAASKKANPAKPTNFLMKANATITAICREIAYPQLTPLATKSSFRVPPVGTILVITTYFSFVLGLEFASNSPEMYGDQYLQAIGIRASWLAIAQVPLLILLAGKNNIIGLATGVSYERLNVLHRWSSRVLLLLTTIHFASQAVGWDEFGLLQLEWSTDTCPPTGIAAYVLLLWLNLSTLAPIRNLLYEFFVVQHLITFFGFIIALMMHLPTTALQSRIWIYVPSGLYVVDRLIRTLRYVYHNARPSHATVEAMEGGVTKIRFQNKRLNNWAPGSFVLLSIPRLSPGQSHPATIASIPASHGGDLVFILKGHKGFTQNLLKAASTSSLSITSSNLEKAQPPAKYSSPKDRRLALIDGPYGSHADFAAFDTVVLVAGSTGVTFTLSLLLDIAYRATFQRLPVRHLQFVWIVKSWLWTSWITPELQDAFAKLKHAGIESTLRIFVTCDDNFTEQSDDVKECGCQCDKSAGPCCCVVLDSEEDSDSITPAASDTSIGKANAKAKISSAELSERNLHADLRRLAVCNSGRPDFRESLRELAQQAEGEMAIAVCGPLGLNTMMRTEVARLSDERAVHKGTGAQGMFLHVECFGW